MAYNLPLNLLKCFLWLWKTAEKLEIYHLPGQESNLGDRIPATQLWLQRNFNQITYWSITFLYEHYHNVCGIYVTLHKQHQLQLQCIVQWAAKFIRDIDLSRVWTREPWPTWPPIFIIT